MLSNRQLFQQHLAQTSEFPLMTEVEKAEGIYLYTPEGKRIIDLISGIGVSNIGHRHPKVVAAIKAQVDKYLHVMVYGEFVESPQVKLAKALSDTLPAPLNNVFLVNSGSEAVEGALKLAKRFTGKPNLVSCFSSYHGSSHGALSVTGDEGFKQKFRPLLPGVRHITFGHIPDLNVIDEYTAAVIIETVQGEAGVKSAGREYFKALRQRCTEAGALLILDEIQCGFGRTGSFWAFEQYDIVPDIVVAAKGMGGGMPIGAFMSSKKVMHVLTDNPVLGHITTFGGHPVSAAASLATLEVIQEQKLFAQAENKAMLFKKLLKHPFIREIRNNGLMMAVQFESFDILKPILDLCLERGVLSDWFLFNNSAMRIAPPLTIDTREIGEACDIILGAIKDA
ncbi:aspartate aminotransferase family protein [uncultured Imperialibacter sp.]|uniref:aspartate aminotransferase family protein n=1 Tax=uncultured Imperialibacter sp. TaxID=1672639 RepID=UPI0030DD6E49